MGGGYTKRRRVAEKEKLNWLHDTGRQRERQVIK